MLVCTEMAYQHRVTGLITDYWADQVWENRHKTCSDGGRGVACKGNLTICNRTIICDCYLCTITKYLRDIISFSAILEAVDFISR